MPQERTLPGALGFGPKGRRHRDGSSLWACPSCLTLSGIWFNVEDPDEDLATQHPETVVPGGEVARVIERLRDHPDDVQTIVDEMRAHDTHVFLLRAPEVFAYARAAIGRAAQATGDTLGFRIVHDGDPDAVRWFPHEPDPIVGPEYWFNDEWWLPPEAAEPYVRLPAARRSGPLARIEVIARFDVIGVSGAFYELVPKRSTWVREGKLRCLRFTLDLVR